MRVSAGGRGIGGQRRYLAHRLFKRKAINSAVLDARVDEAEAISSTENYDWS